MTNNAYKTPSISKGNNIIREAKSNFFKMILASMALLAVGFFVLPSSLGVALEGILPNLIFAVTVFVMLYIIKFRLKIILYV